MELNLSRNQEHNFTLKPTAIALKCCLVILAVVIIHYSPSDCWELGLQVLHPLSHLILTITLPSKLYHPPFADEQTEDPRHRYSHTARALPQTCLPPKPVIFS